MERQGFDRVLHSGYLNKLGGLTKTAFEKRFFVAADGMLYWFASEKASVLGPSEAKGEMALVGIKYSILDSNVHGGHCFSITGPSQKQYVLQAASEEDRVKWLVTVSTVNRKVVLGDLAAIEPTVPPPGFIQGDELRTKCIAANLVQCCGVDFLRDEVLLLHVMTGITSSAPTALMHSNVSTMKYLVRDCLALTSHRLLRIDAFTVVTTVPCGDIQIAMAARGFSQILIKWTDGTKTWVRVAKEEDSVHLAKLLCVLCSRRMWAREGPSVAPREERLFQMRRRHHASAGKVSADFAQYMDMDSYYVVCDHTAHRGLVVSSELSVGFVGSTISDEMQFVLSEPSNSLTQLWRYNSATGRLTSRVNEQSIVGGEEKKERVLQKQEITIYENQRSYPVIGWKAMFLPTDKIGPWSNEDGSMSALSRELLEVQQQALIDQQWRWLEPWAPAPAADASEENWEYGASFQKTQEFSTKQQSFNCRRRAWKRTIGRFQSGENAPVIVECWENQRFYPVVGWSEKVLPVDPPFWSNRLGTKRASKEDRAPPGWAWMGPWKVSQESKSGKDGWIYGTKDFVGCHLEVGWQSEDLPRTTFVRRRRWVRKQVKALSSSENKQGDLCKMPGWLPSLGWLVQTIASKDKPDPLWLAEPSPVCIQSETACNITGLPLYFGLEPQSRVPISASTALEPASASAGTVCIFQPYWNETMVFDSLRDDVLEPSSPSTAPALTTSSSFLVPPSSPSNSSPSGESGGFLAPLVRLVTLPIESAVSLLSPKGPAPVTAQFYPRERTASRIVSPLENLDAENLPKWKLLTALQYYIDYDVQPVLDRIQVIKNDEKLKVPPLERVPFDSARFECLWVDSLSVTTLSVWRPEPPKGYVCFGHFAHSSPLPPPPLFAPAIFKDDAAFKPVKSFSLALCLDYGADMDGESKSLFIWKPEPYDAGYVCLGYVFTTTNFSPQHDAIRCFPLSWAVPLKTSLDLVYREQAGRFSLWRVPYANVVVVGCRFENKKDKKLARIKKVPFGYAGPTDEDSKEALPDCACFRVPMRRDPADSNFWLLKAEGLLVLKRTVQLLFSLSEEHFSILEKHVLEQSPAEDEESDFTELPYMEAHQLLTGARRLLDFVSAADLEAAWNQPADSKEADAAAVEIAACRDLLSQAQASLLRYLKRYLMSLTKFGKKNEASAVAKDVEAEEDPLVDVVGVLDDAWSLLKSLEVGDASGWQDIMAILEEFVEHRFVIAAEKMSEKVAPSEQDLVVAEEEASKEFLTSIGSALSGLKASEEKEKAKPRAESQEAGPAVCILLPRLQDLMRDLYVVADARNAELLATIADFYHGRMQRFFDEWLPPNKLLINHLLQVCAWVTEHADSMETLLGRPTFKKACDELQMKYIDQYCSITKPRLIEICSRMLKIVGQVNPPAQRDECFHTNLPLDFMMNLDVVWGHASKFKLKGPPVETIAFMCCDILAYFQEAYSLTLGSIVFEMVDDNEEDTSVSTVSLPRSGSPSVLSSPPSPEPGFVRLKSSAKPTLSHEHLLAAINDILNFRNLFRELQDELEEQIGGDGERLEELEERTSATDAGFLDIAAKCTDRFGALCWSQNISKFSAVLFTPAWLNQREEVGAALYEALISYYCQFLDGIFEQGKEVLGTRLVRLLITSWTETYIELFLAWCQARVSAGQTAQLDFGRPSPAPAPPPEEVQKKLEEKKEPGVIDLWLAEAEEDDQTDEKVARDIAILKEKMKKGKERMAKGLNSAKKGMKKRAIKLGQIKLGSSPSESTAIQYPSAATIFRFMKEDGEDACSFFMEYHDIIPERMLASCLRLFTDQCEFLQSVVCSDGNLLRWMLPRGVTILAHIKRIPFRDILVMLLTYRGDLTKEAVFEFMKPFEGPELQSKPAPKTKQPVAVSDVIKRSRVTSNVATGKAVTLTGLKVLVHSASGLWIKKVMPNPECKVYLVAPNPPKNSAQSMKRAFISTKKAISGKAANELDADNLRMDATVYAVRKTARAVDTGSPQWEETLSFENLLAKNPFLNFDDLAVRLIVWDPRGFGKKKRFLGMVEQRLRAVEQEVVKQQHVKDHGRARYDMELSQHISLQSTSKVSGVLSFSVELCHSR